MTDSWTRGATVLSVIDAGTVALRLDLGWRIRMDLEAHLLVYASPPESEEGVAAKRLLMNVLNDAGGAIDGSGAEVTFVCHVLDSKGRSHGQVLVTTPQGATFDLGATLMEEGLAVPASI